MKKSTFCICLFVSAMIIVSILNSSLAANGKASSVTATSDEFYADECQKVTLYQKRKTLAETILSTQKAFAEWQHRQRQILSHVHLEAVYTTDILSADSLDFNNVDLFPFDPAFSVEDGSALWQKHSDWQNWPPFQPPFSMGTNKCIYLAARLKSDRADTLTIALWGGDEMKLWHNDNLVFTRADSFFVPDYWWPQEMNILWKQRFEKNQVLVNIPVIKGQNTLLLKVNQQKSDYHKLFHVLFSFDPNPSESLWHQLRTDFKTSREPFLDKVPYTWFSSASFDNWLNPQTADALQLRFYENLLNETDLTPGQFEYKNLESLLNLAGFAYLKEQLAKVRLAAAELHRIYRNDYPLQTLQDSLTRIQQRAFELAHAGNLQPDSEQATQLLSEFQSLQKQALVMDNPMLANQKIVFTKHYTYAPYHYYDEYNNSLGKRFGNSNLCVLSLADGSVTELLPEMRDGLFDRFDLSFDAQKIVFGYQRPEPEGMRIYEVGTDGGNLRQLTFPPDDEEERVFRYNVNPPRNLASDFSGYATAYGHWTDDMHPCYLPDGRIAFVSTRSERGVLCGFHTLTINNLHMMNNDGSNLCLFSPAPLHEYSPAILNDGRLAYSRWEYVDKGVGACQPLWVMHTDGTGNEELYGNNITNPGVFIYPQAIPGRTDQIVCTGATHELVSVGPILLIDTNKDKRDPTAMISVTPEVTVDRLRMRLFRRNDRWVHDIFGPVYTHPWPLADSQTRQGGGSFFLAAGNKGEFLYDKTAFSLYLVDRFGNRVLLYDDPENSCWQPVLLAERKKPPVLADVQLPTATPDTPATLFMTDVYQGLQEYGIHRGEVKYLRVWDYIARPWSAYNPWGSDDAWGQMAVISKHGHLWVQVLLGIVPVSEDGSAHFTVPANRNIFLQALDENYQEIQRMRTHVTFQPGEHRSCIGCHETRLQAPPVEIPAAMGLPPLTPMAQPGETVPRTIHYPADVQPIWDRHCVDCHSGANPQAGLDFSGTLTTYFNTSYETLIDNELVEYVMEFWGPKKGGGLIQNIEAKPPRALGSHASKIVDVLKSNHHGVKLSQTEWIKLVTWIDSNCAYYGSYFGRRNLVYKNHPHFRPLPTVPSAMGIVPEEIFEDQLEIVQEKKESQLDKAK